MARTLGDAFVRVRPDTSRFAFDLSSGLRAAFARASRSADVAVGADTSRLPRQLEADVRSVTARVSRGGSSDVAIGADGRALPRAIEGQVVEASRRVSRSGASDVAIGADGSPLRRDLRGEVADATAGVERSGAADVEVRPDTKVFERQVPSRVGEVAKRAAAAAAAAFAAGAAVLATSSAKAASAQEQSFGAVDSVFGAAAGRVKELASAASTSTGLAAADYAQLSAVLASQLKNMGTAQDDLAPASERLIGLGADLSSTFGGSVADAVGAVSSLLRGERDPIEQYGVSIKQVDIDARLAASGMDKLEGAALTQATTQATLALLFEQTAAAQGQFSREANTAAGVAERLKAQSTNLQATLGTGLTPAVVAAGSAASQTLLPALQRLAEEYAPKVAAVLADDVVPAVQGFFAGLQGQGPIDGFNGKLNTAGLGLRAFFQAMKDGDVTSDGFVGAMERAGSGARGLYDLVVRGDFTGSLGRALDIQEDSAFVRVVLAARDGVQRLWRAAQDLDLSRVTAALGGVVGDGAAAGAAVSSLADSASRLLPFVVELIRSLPQLSDVLSVAAPVFGFLADHVDTLITLMPLLVGGFVALKVAQAASNLAVAAGVPLRIAEIASNQRHTAALAANTTALTASSAATKGATTAEVASTAAKNGGIVASLRSAAATVAARVAQVGATVATGAMTAAQWALNAAMTANPIGIVIALVAALVAGVVIAYKNSETFRRIVDAAFRAVAAAGLWMWENALRPAFAALVGAVVGAWRRFEEFRDRLSAVWAVVRQVIAAAAADVIARVLTMRDRALGFFTGLRDGARDRVVVMRDWVVGAVRQLHDGATSRVGAMRDRALGFFTGLRDGARDRVTVMRDWVIDAAQRARDGLTSRVGAMRDRALGFFTGLRDGARARVITMRDWVVDTVQRMRDGVTSRATGLRDVVVGVFRGLRDGVTDAFRSARDSVTRLMNGIRTAAARPVNFVITTVYMNGIRKLFNRVAGAVGLKTTLPVLDRIPERRRGGWTPRGTVLVGEEGPELVNFARPGMVYTARQTKEVLSRGLAAGDDTGRTKVPSLQRDAARTGALRVRDALPGFDAAAASRGSRETRRGTDAPELGPIGGFLDDARAALSTGAAVARTQLGALGRGDVVGAARIGVAGLSAGAGRLRGMVIAGVKDLLADMPASGLLSDLLKGAGRSLISGLVDFARGQDARADRTAAAAAAASGGGGGAAGPLPPIVGGWRRPGRGGVVTSEFGNRRHPLTGRTKLHNGIDIAALAGLRVLAAQAGRVIQAARVGSYGNFVQLQHANGYKTGYAHLARMLVRVGQAVTSGQQVGVEGATGGVTGRHLHFNVSKGGWINPRRLGVFDRGGVARGAGFIPKATPKPERVLSPRQTETYDRALPVLEQLVELMQARGLGGDQMAGEITGVRVDTLVMREDRDLNRLGAKVHDALLAVGVP